MPAENDKLSPKQERFCKEYVVDCNGKQAAIRAGYSEHTAEVQSSKMLRIPKLAKRIEELQKIVSEKLEITKEKIVKEYAKLAFTNSEELFDWKLQEVDILKPDGQVVKETVAKPFLKKYEDMGENAKAAISEIRETNQGIAIKMHDKKAALDSLSKILGFWTDKQELTGKDGGPIETEFKVNFIKTKE